MGILHIGASLNGVTFDNPTGRHVLTALCNHIDDEHGWGWTSVAVIQKYTGLAERSIRRTLKYLEDEARVLRVVRRSNAVSLYRVNILIEDDGGPPPPHQFFYPGTKVNPDRGARESGLGGDGAAPLAAPRGARESGGGDSVAPDSSLNRQTNDARAIAVRFEDWQPAPELTAWAEEKWPTVDLAEQLAIFKDKCLAGSGDPANREAAFRAFLRRLDTLQHPVPQRRAGTKKAQAEAEWPPERRAAHAEFMKTAPKIDVDRGAHFAAFRKWLEIWPPGATSPVGQLPLT